MNDSYLKALVTALRQNIENLYVSDGYIVRPVDETPSQSDPPSFQWRAYESLWPREGSVFAAIASQFDKFPNTENFQITPYSTPYILLTQVEIRVKGSQGSNDFGLIYDHHEFVINYLNKEVRVNGITGSYANNELNQAFLGLNITKNFAGIDQRQNDLTKMRSLINFEWEYLS